MPDEDAPVVTLLLADEAHQSPFGGLDVKNLGWTEATLEHPHRAIILTLELPRAWAGRTINYTIFAYGGDGSVVQATQDEPLAWAGFVTLGDTVHTDFVQATTAQAFTLPPTLAAGQYTLVVDVEGATSLSWNRRFTILS